jgi:hypothetical protein
VTVLSRRWSTALAVAVLFVAPGAVATTAFGMRFNDVAFELMPDLGDGLLAGSPVITNADAERLLGALVAYLAATLVAGLLGSIGAVAFSRLLAPDLALGGADLGSVLRVALLRTPSVIVFGIVTSAIVVALALGALGAAMAVLTVLPPGTGAQGGPGVFGALVIGVALVAAVVYLTLRWAPAFAIMALEEVGWRRALARSWELSRDRLWRIFAVVALGTVVTLLLSALVAQMLAILVVDWAAPTFGLDPAVAESLVVAIGATIAAPLTPLFVAALTIDLRRRRPETIDPAARPPIGRPSDEP